MDGTTRGVEMGIRRFDPETIVWDGNVVTHDFGAYPELERTEHDGQTVRAFENRPDSLIELFWQAVDTCPDSECVVFPESGRRYTYREMAERVESLAAGLSELGGTPGDRLALVCDSQPEFVETMLASLSVGLVPAPLNTRHSPREFEHVLEDLDPDVVVVNNRCVDTLDQCGFHLPGHRTVAIGTDRLGRAYENLFASEPGDGSVRDTPTQGLVMYTSGTTGQPKGVPTDSFQCVNAVLNNVVVHDLERRIRTLVPAPLFHVTGLVCGLFTAIAVGGTAVILRNYTPEGFVDAIETERIDYCMGIPTHMVLAIEKVDIEDRDCSSFEKFAYGGAPMPSDALPEIRESFPQTELYHSYGKTENFAGIASMLPNHYIDDRSETVGMPTPVMKFAVVDEDRDRLPPGAVGELAMYGPIVADGYLGSSSESDRVFEDGWHYTGDIGRITEDGFIELKDRKGDMIIRGGENIYPSEIEDVLAATDAVRDAGVSSFPDDVLGERVLAAVVPEQEPVTEDQLRRVCDAELAEYKIPDIFRIVDELPRNANGKVRRGELVPTPLQFGIKSGD